MHVKSISQCHFFLTCVHRLLYRTPEHKHKNFSQQCNEALDYCRTRRLLNIPREWNKPTFPPYLLLGYNTIDFVAKKGGISPSEGEREINFSFSFRGSTISCPQLLLIKHELHIIRPLARVTRMHEVYAAHYVSCTSCDCEVWMESWEFDSHNCTPIPRHYVVS